MKAFDVWGAPCSIGLPFGQTDVPVDLVSHARSRGRVGGRLPTRLGSSGLLRLPAPPPHPSVSLPWEGIQESAEALIAPLCPVQAWFPLLLELLEDEPEWLPAWVFLL